jgi:hypothetical protein
MTEKNYKFGSLIDSQEDFTHISLHINSSLDWKTVRSLIDEWTKKFEVNWSTKTLLYYLMDFQFCQKYGQPLELIKYVTSLKKLNSTNYWDDIAEKNERLKMLFEKLDHYRGLALFVGPLNEELEEDWIMANQYENIYIMRIED